VRLESAASLVGWGFRTIDGHDLWRVSIDPADFRVWEGTGDDDRTLWWRYQPDTKATPDDRDQQRIIRRRFGFGDDSSGSKG
jgi:hypothetical protein